MFEKAIKHYNTKAEEHRAVANKIAEIQADICENALKYEDVELRDSNVDNSLAGSSAFVSVEIRMGTLTRAAEICTNQPWDSVSIDKIPDGTRDRPYWIAEMCTEVLPTDNE